MTSGGAAMEPVGSGTVAREGELATLSFRRHLRHPPERVWKAITEPEELRVWCLTDARIVGRRGGTVDLVSGEGRVHATGRVLEWEPPRLWEYEWNVAPDDRFPRGEHAVVRWELTATPEGTLLELTHRRVNPATARRASFGVGAILERLVAHLEGTPFPAWAPLSRTGDPPEGPPTGASR